MSQVRVKLKITGVGRVILASSGEQVTGLEALDDIDELVVEEANQASASGVVNGMIQKPQVDPSRPASHGLASSSSGNQRVAAHALPPEDPDDNGAK